MGLVINLFTPNTLGTMKKVTAAMMMLAAAFAMASCAKDEQEEPATGAVRYETVQATAGEKIQAEITDTKTSIDVSLDPMIRWQTRDQISVFASSANECFEFAGADGDANGSFDHVSGQTGLDTYSKIYAIYPYSASNSVGSQGLGVTFPSTQTYAENTFGPGAAVMVAAAPAAEIPLFEFRNAGGFLKLVLWSSQETTISKIEFAANNGEAIAGSASVNYTGASDPVVTMASGGSSTVTMDCAGGVTLGTTAESATTFWFALPPVTMAGGFTITVTSTEGMVFTKSTTKSRTITRNTINSMAPIECVWKPTDAAFNDVCSDGALAANCYLITDAGRYRFKPVKGNSTTSVGTVASAEVLWETFGTATAPAVGDIIDYCEYSNDKIYFSTTGRHGNAVIAAKDASGKILWSWHIWCADRPADQTYKNNAGVMMDRNLGALSATKGSAEAIGLLYQWGRKDPFLGRASYAESVGAAVSKALPAPVDESTVLASNNTSAYAQAHPSTFLTSTASNLDWYCSESSYRNDALWGATKTVNDPCPAGYRVPNGGPSGVFSTAAGSSAGISDAPWDDATYSMSMASYFGTDIWYPAAVCMLHDDGSYPGSGYGHYWTSTSSQNNAYRLYFAKTGALSVVSEAYRARANSVRCYKESSAAIVPVTAISLSKTSASVEKGKTLQLTATITPSTANVKTVTWTTSNSSIATVSAAGLVTAKAIGSCTITATSYNGQKATCTISVVDAYTDLSASATANCYIVSAAGKYKIKTVKGNSTTSVGTVASASVLWESFGTSTKPAVGDLVSGVKVEGNYITFTASSKKGNAVIVAKNSSGTILWSWHIWMTDKPVDQVYRNNAGTMMDRNVGATSASKGDVKSNGLLFQWGRKDPFLSINGINSTTRAASTGTWPTPVASSSTTGTLTYAISHPTTFITRNTNNYDWLYSESSTKDKTRWSSSKGIYDPCPAGYRVPSGGSTGIWAKAIGNGSGHNSGPWDSTNRGMNFSTSSSSTYAFGTSAVIWYPAARGYEGSDGTITIYGIVGEYWNCNFNSDSLAYYMYFRDEGYFWPTAYIGNLAEGKSVRCQKQ